MSELILHTTDYARSQIKLRVSSHELWGPERGPNLQQQRFFGAHPCCQGERAQTGRATTSLNFDYDPRRKQGRHVAQDGSEPKALENTLKKRLRP